jgi:ubiquinone/menaquinone biosynthesis C-methylase UbiE
VAVDYVPDLMDRGRIRAEAEHLPVSFEEADAEDLPYRDGEFDAVFSVVGVMFAPNQEQAATELVRVIRPGGTIGLANWTPDGFIGHLFKTVGRRVPPPPGMRPPSEWGSTTRLGELFGDRVTDMRVTPKEFVFRFASAAEMADYFRANYGPTLKAFDALDSDGQKLLYEDLIELANRHNAATDGTLKIPSAYVEVLAYKA